MANLESNDIDDLFKRASDKYPLRTDSSDWDKLAAAMEKDPSLVAPSSAEEGDRRRRRRFLWLFLLLPLGGLVYYIGQATGHHTTRVISAAHTHSSQPALAPDQAGSASGARTPTGAGSAVMPANAGSVTAAQPNTVTPSSENTAPSKPAGSTSGAPGQAGASSGTPAPAGNGSTTIIPANARGGGSDPKLSVKGGGSFPKSNVRGGGLVPNSGQSLGGPIRQSAAEGRIASAQKVAARQGDITTRTVSGSTRPKHRPLHNYQYPGAAKESASTSDLSATGAGDATSHNPGGIAEHDAAFSGLHFQQASTTNGVALNVTVKANNATTVVKDSGGKKNIVKNKNDKKPSHFYVGLLVAPDLSTVKMQSVKGVGTTFGILLGYNLNRKWAIETGAYLDHKKYYTDGEYFKGYSNPNAHLLNVDGACNMWEIPVNVRYNLSAGEKTKWFATAGLSTYLMTHQNYVSTYESNGSTWPSSWGSNKPSRYWFSIVNLSVGYEQKLGKIGNLRLEPYLRIPLSEMGSGRLPIMSAGLNIGITRKLW